MLSATQINSGYASKLKEEIRIRRYVGSGTSRPYSEVKARGKATPYTATELIGTIQQGDQRVFVHYADLVDQQFAVPVRQSDKVIVKGRELAIVNPQERKAPDGTVIVYEIQARG